MTAASGEVAVTAGEMGAKQQSKKFYKFSQLPMETYLPAAQPETTRHA